MKKPSDRYNPNAIALVWAVKSTLLRDQAIGLVAKALRKTGGNVRAAAALLGLNHKPLHRVIQLSPELEVTVEALRAKPRGTAPRVKKRSG